MVGFDDETTKIKNKIIVFSKLFFILILIKICIFYHFDPPLYFF